MKKGFTLVEMLVVIGIIAILTGASLGVFSKMRGSAERAKAQELVSQTATALTALFNQKGVWPKAIIDASEGEGLVDGKVAYQLAKRGLMSISYDEETKLCTGLDRFGIVSPWATEVLRRQGASASESTVVSQSKKGKRTVKDHTLRFKVDLDGDGKIEGVNVGGSTVNVRATVAVWCGGKDGVIETYERGQRSDDAYSWAPGQTRNVQ